MMPKNITFLLVSFLISVPVFAKSVITSDFEMKIPRQFQQDLINQRWKSLTNKVFEGNWQFPDQEFITQDIPIQMKGIRLQIATQLQRPLISTEKDLVSLSSQQLQTQLHIEEVKLDYIVEKNVSGIIGQFRVQASCKNIELRLNQNQGDFTLKLKPRIGPSKAGVVVEDVEINWSPGSLLAQPFQCDGAEGFDNLLKDQIYKVAYDSASFINPRKELIKNSLQEYLDNVQFDFSGSKKIITQRPDLEVALQITEQKDIASLGVVLKGQLEIAFTRAPDSVGQYLKLDSSHDFESSNTASIRLPKDFVKTVINEAYKGNSWIHKVASQSLPGFQTLMSSRLLQFFIWPELRKYSKSSQFQFKFYSDKDVKVSGEGLDFNIQSALYALMDAPKAGVYIPFMNFNLPFSSSIKMKVQSGKLSVLFVNPHLGMMAQWDPSYVKAYSPSKRFLSNTIRDRIVGSLWGQNILTDLPRIPLAQDLSLSIQDLKLNSAKEPIINLAP